MIKTEVLESTLCSPQAVWELRGVMRALLAEGYPREGLVDELTHFAMKLWDEDRERDAEIVNDVLADLTGYTAAHMRL